MRKIYSQSGFGLIESLVAIGISATVMTGVLVIAQMAGRNQAQSNTTFGADLVRRNLLTHIKNPNAWANTIADTTNTSFDCFRNNTSCAGQGGSFKIKDAANNLVYDATSATSGFNLNGGSCNNYDPTGANESCPLHFDLTWTPICPDAACLNPQVSIAAVPRYKPLAPSRNIAFNSNNYAFNYVVGDAASGPTTHFSGNGMQVLGEQNVMPACPPASNNGGLCSIPYEKVITFDPPFSAPPIVLVSGAIVSNQGGCVGSATDHVYTLATEITAGTFKMKCSGSPVPNSCGAWNGYYTRASCSWIAIGLPSTVTPSSPPPTTP